MIWKCLFILCGMLSSFINDNIILSCSVWLYGLDIFINTCTAGEWFNSAWSGQRQVMMGEVTMAVGTSRCSKCKLTQIRLPPWALLTASGLSRVRGKEPYKRPTSESSASYFDRKKPCSPIQRPHTPAVGLSSWPSSAHRPIGVALQRDCEL